MKHAILTAAVFACGAIFFWLSGAPLERGEAVAGMFVLCGAISFIGFVAQKMSDECP